MNDRYREAGVDLDEAGRTSRLYHQVIDRDEASGVISEIGHFAAFMGLPGDGGGPLLAASADGVGTKLVLAREFGRMEGIGQDLVAMIVNDLLASGARPLFLLDYLAVEKLHAEEAAAIVASVARAAETVGARLLGGETAELKGLLTPGALDLAGFGVGLVERERLVTGRAIRSGDRLLALRSSGFHSNGYTLIREILSGGVDPMTPLGDGRPLLDALLRPTTLYPPILLAELSSDVHGLAPVTGGGIAGNLERILPADLDALICRSSLRPHPEMELLARRGNVPPRDALRAWNMGVGYIIVASPEGASDLVRDLECETWEIGHMAAGRGDVVWT